MKTNDCLLKTHIPTLLSLWRKNGAKDPLSQWELSKVSDNLLNLQRGLTGNRTLAGSGYMENSAQLGAYLLYYWPVSYMQIYFATKNCPYFAELKNKDSIKILDVGSGPAPASIALCDLLKTKTNNIEVTIVDYSNKALSLAQDIYKRDLKSVTTRKRVQNFENGLPDLEEKFDIIIMSHALNELWKTESSAIKKRTDFLEKLSKNLAEDGVLFLSEPALLETSRNLMKLRDSLIEKGYRILSPCIGNKKCPALTAGQNHTCHADIQWIPIEPVASIAKSAKLDRESVKMTYFIIQKGTESVTTQAENVPNYGKIVSDGMLNKSGRVRFLLCDGEKRIAISAKKDDFHAQKIGFFNLNRYDSVTITNPEIRGDKDTLAYGIKEDTDLRVQKYS